jgi:hypothetical protein
MSLFAIASRIESSDEFHMSRLLVLIDAFSGTSRTEAVEGITKLAKLDFLLRYPSNLERALEARRTNPRAAGVKEYERDSIESAMVRYKYGPWDFRYRRFLNILVGKGLVHIYVKGRTVHISVTEKGRSTASRLSHQPEFTPIIERAALLKTHFDLTATYLMKFVYDVFPEIGTLSLGTLIVK